MANPSRRRNYEASIGRSVSAALIPGSRSPLCDPRWPMFSDAIRALRARGRRAVRIVDADCGNGALLVRALHHARALGFTAIEGRGIGGSPTLIAQARIAALRDPDFAIGITFEVTDRMEGLAEERDLPADILLWHGSRRGDRNVTVCELHRAADVVIGDLDQFRVQAT